MGMKSLRMSKVLSNLTNRRRNKSGKDDQSKSNSNSNSNEAAIHGSGATSRESLDSGRHVWSSPEAVASRSVTLFCESGDPSNAGDEVVLLPPIVDAAESSPQAAAECARLLRKYLKRDHWSKPSHLYNAITLVRILGDNPGPTFTRHLDQKFADTVKELLRGGRDASVHQILCETLDAFETSKADDDGLKALMSMWRKEKERARKGVQGQASARPLSLPFNAPPKFDGHSQNYFARSHTNGRLPDPVELTSRLEEARTSASMLSDIVTNTPPSEVLVNTLIKEFADRCTSASRSIQLYMTAENPAPDNDTMESLINTNEQLQASLSLHQRAMLNARKLAGIGYSADEPGVAAGDQDASRNPSPGSVDDKYMASSTPPWDAGGSGKGKEKEHNGAAIDPFRDPPAKASGSGVSRSEMGLAVASGSGLGDKEPRLAMEPFHPGGFSNRASYVDRQQSLTDEEAMHGAVGGSAAETRASRVDDDDLYDATPTRSRHTENMPRY